MKTKSKRTAMVTLAAVLLVAAVAQADTTVNWSTGGAYLEKIGNNGLFGPEYPGNEVQTNCDKVTLAGASGILTLIPEVPQIVAINPLTFEIGQTGAQPDESYTLTTNFGMMRDITINGVTKLIYSPMTHVVTWYWDSLQVRAGVPVTFGNIIVTPLGWDTAFSGGVGVYDQTNPSWHTISPVYAEFLEAVVIPTAITLASFDAKPGNKKITLQWVTGAETDNAGFNLYRAESEDGEYMKINASLIPAEGSPTQGASYQFIDEGVHNRTAYYYKLEDVDLNGTSTMHGPVNAVPRAINRTGR